LNFTNNIISLKKGLLALKCVGKHFMRLCWSLYWNDLVPYWCLQFC
jgi:hypothetical protein